jgi:DNA-binding MarR family transcriptional regulator
VSDPALGPDNIGFLLAKASQHWNEVLSAEFAAAGFPEVRAAYGSLLVPLFTEDGLRQGELARRARLSKQTLTTMTRALERDGLIERRRDPSDARATLIHLTPRALEFRPVAERILARLDREVAAAAGPRNRAALVQALRTIMALGSERTQSERERTEYVRASRRRARTSPEPRRGFDG